VVAIDLPGRGDRPGDLSTIHVADFVDAVVDELESRDLHDVVLVGHSLAGLTIPQVAGRVPDRIRALVFVSCTVPRDGQTTYDTLDPEIQALSDGPPSEQVGALDPEIATPRSSNGDCRSFCPRPRRRSPTRWCCRRCRATCAACGSASRTT
jgi:pimeloyl-ACP methyl ester carboxylesterase